MCCGMRVFFPTQNYPRPRRLEPYHSPVFVLASTRRTGRPGAQGSRRQLGRAFPDARREDPWSGDRQGVDFAEW